jgi:flavin prenyltransferase
LSSADHPGATAFGDRTRDDSSDDSSDVLSGVPSDGPGDGPGDGPACTGRVPWIVGISGASGTPYAAAVIRALLAAGEAVDLVVSRAARLTLLDETGASLRDTHWRADLARFLDPDGRGILAGADVAYWSAGDLAAGPSSGSYPARGMIVVPASAAACAGIAIGLSKDLLQRAAQVNLKEGRPVVVVPRETPVTRGHLEHLITLHDAGAVVLPASPGFYSAGAAASAEQLVDFIAGKVLDVVGVPHTLFTRWAGILSRPR